MKVAVELRLWNAFCRLVSKKLRTLGVNLSILSSFEDVVEMAHLAILGIGEVLEPAVGGLSVALAIVVFTLLVRLLISPLAYWQVRGERRRAALAPEIERLKGEHKDPVALAMATMELQRARGASPFAAFLPALAQAPFFMVMYRVAVDAPAGAVFGVPLTAHLLAGLPVFAVLLALAIMLARWSSRRMARTMAATPGGVGNWLRFLPYLTVAAVAWFPLAGAIYLVTSTAWTALEQLVWRRQVTTGNR